MPLPTFLLLGAQKAGTTALYHYLRQHPEVLMSSQKEPNFFIFEDHPPTYREADGGPAPINTQAVTTRADYEALFDGWQGERAIGEATPHYLYFPEAIPRIQHYVPDARLVAILRNPIERAYSGFLNAVRDGREPLTDFNEALAREADRIAAGYALLYRYQDFGFYGQQLARYYDAFPREQLRVYLHDDLQADAAGLLGDLYGFVGVDPGFVPDLSYRPNRSGVPKNRLMHTFTQAFLSPKGPVRRLYNRVSGVVPAPARWRHRLEAMRGRNLSRPPLPDDARKTLQGVFRDDIHHLEALLGRDLSHWLAD